MSASAGTGPVVSITFCGYRGAQRFWAFNQMGTSRRHLARAGGLRFWRLLGTGHGRGFSLRPDFSRYGVLAVWASMEAADAFLTDSPLMHEYRRRAYEVWTVVMRAYGSRGSWSGSNPFLPVSGSSPAGPVGALTRASIRVGRLRAFWRAVPATTAALDTAPGLLASVGTGDIPFVRPATFSLWRSEADLMTYAYGSAEHRDVIARRAAEGWYSEELFARFAPVRSDGLWNGADPLEGLLP